VPGFQPGDGGSSPSLPLQKPSLDVAVPPGVSPGHESLRTEKVQVARKLPESQWQSRRSAPPLVGLSFGLMVDVPAPRFTPDPRLRHRNFKRSLLAGDFVSESKPDNGAIVTGGICISFSRGIAALIRIRRSEFERGEVWRVRQRALSDSQRR
jgi:hypothetical protein